LDGYLDDFEAALSLFDNACNWQLQHKEDRTRANLIGQWQWIAARDGGMTIYHLGSVMDAIRASFKECETFRAKLGHDCFRGATKKLKNEFPLYIKVRHAISHSGEIHSSPGSREINSVSGAVDIPGFIKQDEGANCTVIAKGLVGRNYYNSFEGQVISYEISSDSLQKLTAIRNLFVAGFNGVDERRR